MEKYAARLAETNPPEKSRPQDEIPSEKEVSDSSESFKPASQTEDEDSLSAEENPSSYLPMVIESDLPAVIEEETDALETKRKEANKIVLGFTTTAGATGAIPIPFADAPLLVAQQVGMIAALSDLYQINLKKSGLKSLIFTVLGVSGTTVLGKTITGSLLKALPGIGSVGGAVLSGTTAAALTAALGAAYTEVCEKVFLGELDESLLLEYEGRHLLETSFKNHLRLELNSARNQEDEDVLEKTPVPDDDEPIVLNETKLQKKCSGSAADLEEVKESSDSDAPI